MTIRVVSHLPNNSPLPFGYEYIFVGDEGLRLSSNQPEMTDRKYTHNIANKNSSYCELTALHQISIDAANNIGEIYGLVHYRRRFLEKSNLGLRIVTRAPSRLISPQWFHSFFIKNHLSLSEVERVLSNESDVILPVPWMLSSSVAAQYAKYHDHKELLLLRESLEIASPEYLEAFDKVLLSWRLMPFNMMIARGGVIVNYSKWLFDVLDIFESRIDLTIKNSYQMRIFGFVAERLLNVYFEHNKSIRVHSLPVAFISQ